jgi:hypothetical protein
MAARGEGEQVAPFRLEDYDGTGWPFGATANRVQDITQLTCTAASSLEFFLKITVPEDVTYLQAGVEKKEFRHAAAASARAKHVNFITSTSPASALCLQPLDADLLHRHHDDEQHSNPD